MQCTKDDISNRFEVEAAVDREPQGARLGDGLIDIPRDNVRAAGGTLRSKLCADHIFRMAPVHSEFGARMTDRDQIADVRIKKPGVRFQPLQREIVAEARQIAEQPVRGALEAAEQLVVPAWSGAHAGVPVSVVAVAPVMRIGWMEPTATGRA